MLLIKMNKTIKSIALALALPIMASAQDFYNGCRGPRTTQLDTYLTHSDSKTSGMVIPKLFTDNFILAAPFSVSEKGKVENKGINLGKIVENGNNFILATGLFKDGKGDYNILNPQFYLTKDIDRLSIDLEGSLPFNLKNNEKGKATISATAGLALTDRLRIGPSITKQESQDYKLQGIARLELTKDHKYWFQLYVRKKEVGIRLAINH